MEMDNIMGGEKLPEGAITEILLRLPVKSIIRFKSVCKNWYSLITSSSFISMHLNHVNSTTTKDNASLVVKRYSQQDDKNVLTFFSKDEKEQIELDLKIPVYDPAGHYPFIEIYGPCNGVLCLYVDFSVTVLCNPSIREFKVVPTPCVPYPPGLHSNLIGTGFGFDPVNNDFKVIGIVELCKGDVFDCYGHHSYKAEVYDLSTDCWRGVEPDCLLPALWNDGPCEMLFNGAFHWPATVCEPDLKWVILAFHLSTEVFQTIRLPDLCSDGSDVTRSFDVLNGWLALILFPNSHNQVLPQDRYFDIWVMKEYGNVQSWTKLFIVRPIKGLVIETPLAIRNDGELYLETSKGQLVSFNIYTEQIKEYDIHEVPTSLRVVFYKESLISIHGGVKLSVDSIKSLQRVGILLNEYTHTDRGLSLQCYHKHKYGRTVFTT